MCGVQGWFDLFCQGQSWMQSFVVSHVWCFFVFTGLTNKKTHICEHFVFNGAGVCIPQHHVQILHVWKNLAHSHPLLEVSYILEDPWDPLKTKNGQEKTTTQPVTGIVYFPIGTHVYIHTIVVYCLSLEYLYMNIFTPDSWGVYIGIPFYFASKSTTLATHPWHENRSFWIGRPGLPKELVGKVCLGDRWR